MAGELSNILNDIVKRAAEIPVGKSDEIARLRQRFAGASKVKVALVDVSGSMGDLIGLGDVPKIEHCRIALTDLLVSHPDMKIIAFGSIVQTLKSPADLPTKFNLWGGTNLAGAIEEAILLKPARTIIISDGVPDNERSAIDACQRITGQIDCVYCGPDQHPAVQFLASLAKLGGGTQMTFDGCLELGTMMHRLLGAG